MGFGRTLARHGPAALRRGILKFALLKLLAEMPSHGYDLIRAIREKGWGGGAGSVYPLLGALEAAGFIAGRDEGDRRTYELTEKGRQMLEEHAADIGRFFEVDDEEEGAGDTRAQLREAADRLMHAVSQLGYSSKAGDGRARARAARRSPQRNLRAARARIRSFRLAQARTAHRGVNIFEEGKPMWQILLVFLVPLMLSNVLQSASQTMASIWIGRLISTQALAAISAVFPIVFLLFSFVFGVSSGSSVSGRSGLRRARLPQGQEDRRHRARRGALPRHHRRHSSARSDRPSLLKWLATPPDILPQSDAYARVIFLTMPIFFFYFVYVTILRGTGDSTTPFYTLIVSSVLAIAVTPLFIIGVFGLPKLGVVSAAVAGLIANSGGARVAALLSRAEG